VSTSSQISDQEIEKIRNLCSLIIIRKDIGRDFGSWKIAVEKIKDLSLYTQVILTNDSVYGPMFDFSKIFKEMEERNPDMWGITNSLTIDNHIQSYFMVFNKKMINK